MSWLILVLISATLSSFSTLLKRVLLKEEQSDPVAYGSAFQMVAGVLVLIYAIYKGFVLPTSISLLPNLAFMSLAYAVGYIALFKGFQTLDAAEVDILFSSRIVWASLTAALFLQEHLTLQRVWGIALVVLGTAILSWRGRKWVLEKGYVLVIGAAILFGAALTNNAYLTKQLNVPTSVALGFILPAVTMLTLRPKSIVNLKVFIDKGRLFKLTAASAFLGAASVVLFLAYEMGGDVSRISPIHQTSVVLTVILGSVFLRERSHLLNKVLGALVVLIGVVVLKG